MQNVVDDGQHSTLVTTVKPFGYMPQNHCYLTNRSALPHHFKSWVIKKIENHVRQAHYCSWGAHGNALCFLTYGEV